MRQKVLMVGGEPESRIRLGCSLSEGGFTVEISADAYEALRKVQETPYDIAIINHDVAPTKGSNLTVWDLARVFRAFNPSISIVYLGAGLGKHEQEREELGVGSAR